MLPCPGAAPWKGTCHGSACALWRMLWAWSREAERIGVDTELLCAALEPSQLSPSLLLSIWQWLERSSVHGWETGTDPPRQTELHNDPLPRILRPSQGLIEI